MDIPSSLQRFRLIQLPQTGWVLGASWYVVFLLSLWDADTLIFVIPPGAETLALRIFNLLHYGHNAQVNGLTLLMMFSALTPYIIWQLWRLFKKICTKQYHHSLLPSLTTCGLLCLMTSSCNAPISKDTATKATLDSRIFETVIVIGTQGRSPGFFIKPRSLTVDANDFLYVVDMTGRVQKFDPDGVYIRKFIPEIKKLPNKYIFSPWETPINLQQELSTIVGQDYPRPIVEIKSSRELALSAFASIKQN